jgi:hypothetical protein
MDNSSNWNEVSFWRHSILYDCDCGKRERLLQTLTYLYHEAGTLLLFVITLGLVEEGNGLSVLNIVRKTIL